MKTLHELAEDLSSGRTNSVALTNQALARIERQMPLEEKRRYADEIIDTTGSFDETRELAHAVYVKLGTEGRSRASS